jgi:hypothetical protein
MSCRPRRLDLLAVPLSEAQLPLGDRKRGARTAEPVPYVLIEDKASGTQLIQELIVEGCGAVTK